MIKRITVRSLLEHIAHCGVWVMMLATVSACTSVAPVQTTQGDAFAIVASDEHFVWVRMTRQQSYANLAERLLKDAGAAWQIAELNGGGSAAGSGQMVVVPRLPVNPSSVFIDGYRTIPILCYHQFTPGSATTQRLEVSAQAFRQQLQYLRDNNFTVLSLDQVAAILDGDGAIPERAVVLTIDDGYRSVYDVAWPIIREFGFHTTLYIYTDFVGGGKALTWAQMREMQASGLVDIQSHAKSHTSLARLPEDTDTQVYKRRVAAEVMDSASVFNKRLGDQPKHLSYPYGNSSPLAAQVLSERGYHSATTVTRGDNTVFSNRFLLHRTMLYDNHSLEDFAKFVRNFKRKELR